MIYSAQQQRAGELLALAEDCGAMGSWSWAVGSEELDWSPGMFRMLGLDPAVATASVRTYRDALHPDDLEPHGDLNRLLSPGWIAQQTFRVVWPGGQVRRVRAHGKLAAEDGAPVRAWGVVFDITGEASATVEPLSHAQVRAARAFLGWTALELAAEAGVSFSTVRRVEIPGRAPCATKTSPPSARRSSDTG